MVGTEGGRELDRKANCKSTGMAEAEVYSLLVLLCHGIKWELCCFLHLWWLERKYRCFPLGWLRRFSSDDSSAVSTPRLSNPLVRNLSIPLWLQSCFFRGFTTYTVYIFLPYILADHFSKKDIFPLLRLLDFLESYFPHLQVHSGLRDVHFIIRV